ncbi:MAG TPA: efflux RND transporter permease subunit, partial [Draconibacterium sp.]|nr:efflux RND transporter permease subunit [Draconibacterium sp.]
GLLAFLSMFLFLREKKAPWLIGISIPVSLVISLLLFYLTGLSINIISLSGLVLGVGMMIDNSIIVIDNITQHRQRHALLDKACEDGTNEITRPLISSVLTTCAVFIPLIFMRGMSGALFFDQAVAVSIGLTVSLLVSITLLPTLYRIFYAKDSGEVKKTATPLYFHWYESGLKFVLRNPLLSVIVVLAMVGFAVVLYGLMHVSRFPQVTQEETVLEIDWNEPVNLAENNTRTEQMLEVLSEQPVYVIEEAGLQQYMLNSGQETGTSENKLYLKTASPKALKELENELSAYLDKNFPYCDYSFSETDNIFNLAFGKTEAPLIARFSHDNPGDENYLQDLSSVYERLENEFPGEVSSKLLTRQLILLETDPEMMMYYQIDNGDLEREVKSAFNVNNVLEINSNNMLIPVRVGNSYSSVYDILLNLTVLNSNGIKVPVSSLIKTSAGTDLKTIVAGKDGEYFPVSLNIDDNDFETTTGRIKALVEDERMDVSFSGAILSNKGMINELIVIISISLLLLYFILAAQFESFVLPVIVLLEVPIDLFGAFLFLKIFGEGINIMSAIGVIVMTGIIINDSILKIDTINKLMDAGNSLVRSVMEAGRRRLKPIIMTSLTTILAMMPFLFQKGMGAELQKPLALAIIGGMTVGTLVSLFFIPLMYYLLKRKKYASVKQFG